MYKILIFLVAFFVSCGPHHKNQAERVVSYNGVIESYYHPDFNSEEELKIALNDDKIPDFIIFSSSFCGACTDLKHRLNDLGWRDKVIVLNFHEEWVQFISKHIGIVAIPSMVVDTDRGETLSKIFVGQSSILKELYDNFGEKSKNNLK